MKVYLSYRMAPVLLLRTKLLETFGVTWLTRKVDDRYDHEPRASSTCPRNLVSKRPSILSLLSVPVRPFTAISCNFPKSPYEVVQFESI